MSSLAIGRGKRALIAGMTGSGKTTAGIFLIQYVSDYPVYIFDTKIEESFKREFGKMAEVVDGISGYNPLKAKKPFVILRPDSREATDPELIDSVLFNVHDKVEGCTIYIDEAYQLHNNGRPGPGLVGALTRGRSRKQTVIMNTQRPSWISRFCFTESDQFYIFRLGDKRDRQTLMQVIPDENILNIPPKYHFFFYSTDELYARLYKPFPLHADDVTRDELRKMIDGISLATPRAKKKLTLV